MPIFFIFSLGVFELFLLFIHGLLGAVLLEIFPNFVAYKLALGVLLFLLGCSFLVATIWSAKVNNRLTRVAYTISSVWMGFFFYYFWSSVLYVVLVALLYNYVLPETFIVIGRTFFVVATIVSLYGFWQAQRVVVTKLSIALPNLPVVWKKRSLVFISDIHLGQFYGAWFSRKLVEKIKALSPTLVCVGGDLYDGAMVDKELVIEPFKKLVPPLGLYFITGNHEEFEDTQKYISVIKEVGMRVLNNEKVDIDGLQLVGVDYKDTVKKKAYTKIMENLALDRQKPSILLKHTPRDMEVAERAGISLQISGHTHKAQMYPLSYITRALYKGFDYGLKKFGTMSVYTSSGVGSWGPPMRVGSRAEIVEIHFV